METFKAIMEESKKFREEIRNELAATKEELKSARAEILTLQKQAEQYIERIASLEDRLKEALKPTNWIYYYIQKPLKKTEIETLVGRYVNDPTDAVLVVDDDPSIQKIFEELSEDHEWNILRAYNGAKALDMLKLSKPKVIFLDLVMPVVDGFEVLNAIHQNKELTTTPIVVISGTMLKDVDRISLHAKMNEAIIQSP